MDPLLKRQRPRGASLSGRLRSASDLCEEGVINSQEKGVLKDMIILGDTQLDAAFAEYEKGNLVPLKEVLHLGAARVLTQDIVSNGLDINLLSVADSDKMSALDFEDIPFDSKPVLPKGGSHRDRPPMVPGPGARSRFDSQDVHAEFGRAGVGGGLSTPSLLASAGVSDPFLLGDDFNTAFLGERVSEGPSSRFATPSLGAVSWSSALLHSMPTPSMAASHALVMGLSQHIPPGATREGPPGSLSPFIGSGFSHLPMVGQSPFPPQASGAPSPSMSPFFGSSPFYSSAFGNLSDLAALPAASAESLPDGGKWKPPVDSRSRSLLQANRRRANSNASFEPMASFRQPPTGDASPWFGSHAIDAVPGTSSPGSIFRGSFDAGHGRKASIDDAWRNASDVFDEDMEHGSRGEFALLDVADASDDDAGAPRAYGKSLSSLKVTRSRTKEGQSKPFRPGPPVARGMPPPPSAEDAAQLWSHSHGTRLAKSFATGSTRYDGLRRRRGDDYDEDDYDGSSRSGATTRSSTLRAPNGFIGAYSPDARRRRILKFLEKRRKRVWARKVKYDVRKSFADSRLRVKGRFVKKEDEELLRDLMQMV